MKKLIISALIISLCMCAITPLTVSSASGDMPATPYAIRTDEIEPNNEYEDAQEIFSDYTVSASFTYISEDNYDDYDIYYVEFPISGTANFWIGNIPSSADIDLLILDENYNEIGWSGGTGDQELVTANVTADEKYYICVYPYELTETSTYTLRTRVSPATYAYYCQNNMTGFDTTNLWGLFQTATSTKSMYEMIRDEGCVMSSIAMVLNNMGKTTVTQEYDHRFGTTGYLEADPFTVTMANCNFTEPVYDANSGRYVLNTTFYPVAYQSMTRIGDAFGATPKQLWLTGYTAEQKAQILAYYIAQNPEGVTAWFGSTSNNHTIVFTGTTYEIDDDYTPPQSAEVWSIGDDVIMNTEVTQASINVSNFILENKLLSATSNNTIFGSKFTVYDPVNNAAGVLFNQTWTATEKGWDSLYRIIYFE